MLEQEEYKAEGIDWTYVPFVNNQSLLVSFLFGVHFLMIFFISCLVLVHPIFHTHEVGVV